MKILCAFIVLSATAMAADKQDHGDFHKALMENAKKVILNNPEKFEKNRLNRRPASVTPERVEMQPKRDERSEDFHERPFGLPKW